MEKYLGDPDQHERPHLVASEPRVIYRPPLPWPLLVVVALGAIALGYLWCYFAITGHPEIWGPELMRSLEQMEERGGR